ncbi:MAG: penicillin-binding transpeptidase domain-containing protein [Bacteroidota bacterium]
MQAETRRLLIQGVFLLVAVVFLLRLFFLQILDDTYKQAANNNALQKVTEYPYRGVIYDRNGKILVFNVPVYDMMVIPREVKKGMDTLAFCSLMNITKEDFITKMKAARFYSRVKPSPFIKQLSGADFARVQDQFIDYPGFSFVPRTVRNYPHKCMANALGYIGEINQDRLDKQGKGYYKTGDYIGISGLEAKYEEALRGRRGVQHVLVDVHGIRKGSFKNGIYDTTAVRGENLHSSMDLALQEYGESLMVNKAGSIVAIEPSTGEILAFVSAPNYDPNLLTGREFSKNYTALYNDPNKPLFNRALMAMYRPGSTFKAIQAVSGLQLGMLDRNTTYGCVQNLVHCHPHPQPCNLPQSIQWSCNPYWVNAFRRVINRGVVSNTFRDTRVGFEKWRPMVMSFGLGEKLGLDMPGEQRGRIPSLKYYDKMYGEARWKYSNIYSISIGEGELGILPVQLANVAATFANRGWYITPHFIKSIGDKGTLPEKYSQKHVSGIASEHFETVIEGMEQAVEHGTVWSAAKIPGIAICGKTGTSVNRKGKDHSIFMCFAPKDNPKIAIACFVENAGFGGFAAAPIATLMIEKYLTDSVKRKNLEKHMISRNYLHPELQREPEPEHTGQAIPASGKGKGAKEPEKNKTSAGTAAPPVKATAIPVVNKVKTVSK